METMIGSEVESNITRASQVYQVTHKGEQYLPFMNRSFISFTYGGKHIEDFNLVATISGNRMNRNGYASVDQLTTSYDVGHGQYYWGSYYKSNSLSFTLSTDAMDQRQLDDFVWWFAADQIRELILAEHPNRAIMARVNTPPKIALLPFEKKIDVKIGEKTYKTSTTLYRGEIELDLVMDEPHWYSVVNIFGHQDSIEEGGMYRDVWIDANGQERSIDDDPDAIKIAYEDGIPISSMLSESMLLGDNTYATVKVENNSCIATMSPEIDYRTYAQSTLSETYVSGAVVGDDTNQQATYTFDEETSTVYTLNVNGDEPHTITITEVYPIDTTLTVGRIAGPKMTRDTSYIVVNPSGTIDSNLFFYYTGTAPAPVKLTFTLQSSIENGYITVPHNKFVPTTDGHDYNTIIIESTTKQELKFTTPSIYTAYNAVIKIFKESIGLDWPALTEKIRDFVYHPAVRAWAMKVLDFIIKKSGANILMEEDNNNFSTQARQCMQYMFQDSNGVIMPATYMFNSKTGEAKGQFSYRDIDDTIPSTLNNWINYGVNNIVQREENIGDMLKSNYLIIRDRNYSKDGLIRQWYRGGGEENSHRLYHDLESPISGVRVEYKNMYL